MEIASFVRWYPGEFKEGRISWPWFRYLNRWLPNVRASEVLATAQGTFAGAVGLIDGGVSKDMTKTIEKEIRAERK